MLIAIGILNGVKSVIIFTSNNRGCKLLDTKFYTEIRNLAEPLRGLSGGYMIIKNPLHLPEYS